MFILMSPGPPPLGGLEPPASSWTCHHEDLPSAMHQGGHPRVLLCGVFCTLGQASPLRRELVVGVHALSVDEEVVLELVPASSSSSSALHHSAPDSPDSSPPPSWTKPLVSQNRVRTRTFSAVSRGASNVALGVSCGLRDRILLRGSTVVYLVEGSSGSAA